MIAATSKRIDIFNELRNQKKSNRLFWDVVVITAADDSQKAAYEKQVKEKLSNRLLPLSADYIVIADPPNYKIGNGGSTLVVLKELRKRYGETFAAKRTIIVHAGGYSQRLPSASVMGKVFMSIPNNDFNYQMLELKLASYVDFPDKIEQGGVFVSCSDTFEPYHDQNMDWKFPNTGFTGLAHPSSLEIGTTHGVYIVDASESSSLIQQCRKFLHKPSVKLMRDTENCVYRAPGGAGGDGEMVLTDSCYFMSPDACHKLIDFFAKHEPLTCEVDAYGDFLQCLGTEADPSYINNTANVVRAVPGLTEMRTKVFDHLHGTPLHVVVLADVSGGNKSALRGVTSRFYHFGTTQEYLSMFTEDRDLIAMLELNPVSCSAGIPYYFPPVPDSSDPPVMPYVMSSVIHAGASVGERSMVEFCMLHECTSIGRDCIVSHCELGRDSQVPSATFMHTVPVRAGDLGCEFACGFCTVVFGINDSMKKRCRKSEAGSELTIFGSPLNRVISDVDAAFSGVSGDDVTLWEARLYLVCLSARESSAAACSLLSNCTGSSGDFPPRKLTDGIYLSMSDILRHKDLDAMMTYRKQLKHDVDHVCLGQSSLPEHERSKEVQS